MPSDPPLLAGTKPPRDYDADIIILAHHRPRETILAIKSAAAQTGCDHHIIVLDQGSDAAMRNSLAALVNTLPNVALYAIDTNLGVPGGRNLVTALGHGRAIIALDNDATFAAPDITARAASRLAANPALAAIGFCIMAADGHSLDPTSWGYPSALLPRAATHFPTTTFVGCGHAISRSWFTRLGGYDASLFFTWEEYEFARRAIDHGATIEHHGDLAVIHAVSPEARITWNGPRWHYHVRNRLLIAHDRHGTIGIIPRACLYLLQGTLNRRPLATITAIRTALTMAQTRPRQTSNALAQLYVHSHETSYRYALGRLE